MPQSTPHIREDLFQKQHAEAMQALLWALYIAKQNQAISDENKAAIRKLAAKHRAAFEKEQAFKDTYDAIEARLEQARSNEAINKAIDALKQYEKEYLEDLERKATRHKLSIFFALFMAIGCGATMAGSNFLMGVQYNWVANMAFLATVGLISLPIIMVVAMANWWLAVRAVPDLENMNRDPYKLSKRLLGEYKWWKAPLFALSIALIEIYNGIFFNFQEARHESEEGYARWYNSFPVRMLFYLTVFLASAIYAFFAFAATYDLGMGIFELLKVQGIIGGGGFTAAASTSVFFGILMAVPTYITMKTINFLSAKTWMDPNRGPLKTIEEIPGWKKPRFLGMNLKQIFIASALMIIISVGFITYAAADPLSAWLKMAGMTAGDGVGVFALVTVLVAFVGNIPFYVNSAANSFKQMFDPREQLNSKTGKWFPYIRFWNATLNALPAIVGVLAFMGVLGVSGPFALLLPVALNLFIAGAASYAANSTGAPTMYKFDAAKQISQYQLSCLDKLKEGQKIELYQDMRADQQLKIEYFGAQTYLHEGNPNAKMPALATALNQLFIKNVMFDSKDKQVLYQAFNEPFRKTAFRGLARTFSALAHSNVRYTNYLFPHDYLSRIEYYASEPIKRKLYDHALLGGGDAMSPYATMLGMHIPKKEQPKTLVIQDFIFGADATLFWKAYGVRSSDEQLAIIKNLNGQLRTDPQFQEKLMQHSKPETRKEVVKSIARIEYFHSTKLAEADKWRGAYRLFHKENYLQLNALTGFWGKNLIFPFILMADGVASMGSWALRRMSMGNAVAAPLNIYEYLTELADDETRKIYLCDVLCGYMMTPGTTTQQTDAAEKLRHIILGDIGISLTSDDAGEIKSGIVGLVFDVAASIPEVSERLKIALDNVEGKAVAPTLVDETTADDERLSTSSSPVEHGYSPSGGYAKSPLRTHTPVGSEDWVAYHSNRVSPEKIKTKR